MTALCSVILSAPADAGRNFFLFHCTRAQWNGKLLNHADVSQSKYNKLSTFILLSTVPIVDNRRPSGNSMCSALMKFSSKAMWTTFSDLFFLQMWTAVRTPNQVRWSLTLCESRILYLLIEYTSCKIYMDFVNTRIKWISKRSLQLMDFRSVLISFTYSMHDFYCIFIDKIAIQTIRTILPASNIFSCDQQLAIVAEKRN